MSKPRNYLALIQLPPDIRRRLLALCPPRFQRVYANRVTLAYNVPGTYPLPRGPVVVAVKASIETDRFQSLLVTVNGDYVRQDGKINHITLSVPTWVEPAEAGRFTADDVEALGQRLSQPFQFSARASLLPRMVMPWEDRDAVLAA